MTDYLTQALVAMESQRETARNAKRSVEAATITLLETILEKRDWEQLLEIPVDFICGDSIYDASGLVMAHVICEGRFDVFTPLHNLIESKSFTNSLLKHLVELEVTWDQVKQFLPRDGMNYAVQAIKADKADLLSSYLGTVPIHNSVFPYIGQYLAKNCMELLGYKDHERSYLEGAVNAQNLESVQWLLSKSEATRDHFVNSHILTFSFDPEEVDFSVKIVRSGLVTLTEEEWKTMQENNIRLYNELQNDV